jgi:hypothetical protein
MPKEWKLKPGQKRCSRELCKQPAIRGERYCSACKATVMAELEEQQYLERLDRDTISIRHRRKGDKYDL